MRISFILTMLVSFSITNAVDFFDGFENDVESSTPSENIANEDPSVQYDSMRLPTRPAELSYNLKSKPKQVTKQNFDPLLDAPQFQNFGSVVEIEDEGKHYEQGNCFGISYMTALWYQEYESGSLLEKVSKFKQENPSQMDGVEFLARKVNTKHPKLFSRCGKTGKRCRLRNLSRKKSTTENVTKAMMFHQARQQDIKLQKWMTDDPEKLASQMQETRELLDKHGTLFFVYDIFSKSQKFDDPSLDQEIKPTVPDLSRNESKTMSQIITELAREANDSANSENESEVEQPLQGESNGWDQFIAGHSMVLYRISEQEVELSGRTQKALRLDFYDSNESYRSKKKANSAEGFGSYLLYYPELKKITFSDHMRGYARVSQNDDPGALQKDQAFLENTQTVVGIQELWSAHETREKFKEGMPKFEKARKTTEDENMFWAAASSASSCADLKAARDNLGKQDGPRPFGAAKSANLSQKFASWYQKDKDAIQNMMADNMFYKRVKQLPQAKTREEAETAAGKLRTEIYETLQNQKCSFVASVGSRGGL